MRLIVPAVLAVAACFSPVAVARDRANRAPSSNADMDLPAICKQEPRALGGAGRRMLAEFEAHLIDDVVSNTYREHDDGAVSVADVRDVLRSYPTARVAFLFPAPVALPRSSYRLQMGGDVEELRRAPDVVFYVQLSNVKQVRVAGKLGLVLEYTSWPTGTRPQGIVWMWGKSGTVCLLREAAGWRGYPFGGMVVK